MTERDDLMELQGRSAIVTGGAGGLGAATVRRLVDIGVRVAVFDLDADRAGRLVKELGDDTLAVSGDVNDDDAVAGAIEAARSLGPLSILVNVAGGGVGGSRTVRRGGVPHGKDSFTKTMEMNAVGTFNVSRLVAAAMAENEPDENGQRGVVVNTASIAGMEGQSGQVAYSAAKAAILGMTLPMARDLAPIGVRVCAIAPGMMGTPLMLGALEHLKEDPAQGIVFPKRLGYPEEFAMMVESIVRNPYLNGENIRLDGALRFTVK
jgi:NAD(P)-dependent dehydrogenase (short-subunit alcohol dehydrogenase family)